MFLAPRLAVAYLHKNEEHCLFNKLHENNILRYFCCAPLKWWLPLAVGFLLQRACSVKLNKVLNKQSSFRWFQRPWLVWLLCSVLLGNLHRGDSRLAPSQWETSLQSNTISHWLVANLESALLHYQLLWIFQSGLLCWQSQSQGSFWVWA